jgi:hypothetical protein
MSEIGPVEYMVVAFPGNNFRGEIAPALQRLVESETIRIIDLVVVSKDADGEVATLEISELDPDVQAGLERMGIEGSGLFNEEDLAAAAEELEADSTAALLVWEDVWATRLVEAIRDADGVLLDLGRIPHEIVVAAREWATANA